MKIIKDMVHKGWAVKIWPHHRGFTVVFDKAGEAERIGRGYSIRAAAKRATRDL